MLKPSKKTALALEAVVDIAFHGTADPVQSQDIGRRLQLPRRYLEQVMQQLVRAGILKGVRGPRGGYRLARERRRISVADVVRVVTGQDEGVDATARPSPSQLGVKVMNPFWEGIEAEMMQRLEAVTVDDLCNEASKSLRRTSEGDIDFAI